MVKENTSGCGCLTIRICLYCFVISSEAWDEKSKNYSNAEGSASGFDF